MNREVWIHAQSNLPEILENADYKFLIQYADDNQEHIMEKWYNADYSSCTQTLRFGNSQLKHLKQYLKKSSKDYAIFHMGTLMGIIETLECFSYEKDQEDLNTAIYAKQVASIKHLKDIIQLLEAHGIMSHSEICRSLNLKESTLSEIMKKNTCTNLIISSRSGKYKLYRLTDNGRYLSRQLRSSSPNIHDIRERGLIKRSIQYMESISDLKKFREKETIMPQDNREDSYATKIAPGNTLEIMIKNNKKKEIFDIDALVVNHESTGSVKVVATKKAENRIDFLNNANNY